MRPTGVVTASLRVTVASDGDKYDHRRRSSRKVSRFGAAVSVEGITLHGKLNAEGLRFGAWGTGCRARAWDVGFQV